MAARVRVVARSDHGLEPNKAKIQGLRLQVHGMTAYTLHHEYGHANG